MKVTRISLVDDEEQKKPWAHLEVVLELTPDVTGNFENYIRAGFLKVFYFRKLGTGYL